MPQITVEELREAAARLARSTRGRAAMGAILDWLDDGGMSLDASNVQALMLLMMASFTTHPGTARDLMRDALEA